MNSRRQPWILWVAFLIGVTGSLWSAVDRNKIEQSSKQVELVLDYDSIVDLATKEVVPLSSALDRVKESGITAIGLSEMTLERLRSNGKVAWFKGEELLRFGNLLETIHPVLSHLKKSGKISPQHIYAWSDNRSLLDTIRLRFRIFLSGKNRVNDHWSPTLRKKSLQEDKNLHSEEDTLVYMGTIKLPVKQDDEILEIKGDAEELKDFGLGIYEPEVQFLESKGFRIVPRFENKDGLDRPTLSYLLYERKPSSSIIIFSGIRNEVLGYKHLIKDTAELFRNRQYNFGAVEVYDKGKMQKGSQTLARLLPEQTVRVQTIPSLQMTKITSERAVDMFMLGVRERNIRVLYLRPFMMIPDMEFGENETKNIIDLNMSFFENLSNKLKAQGFQTGQASVFPLLERSLLISIFSIIGVIGAFALIMYYSGYLFNTYFYLAAILLVIIITAVCWHQEGLFGVLSKGTAISAGIIFSVLASLCGWKLLLKNEKKVTVCLTVLSICIMAAISIIGGLVIAALLRGNLYMLGIDQARGIKLILLVPPAVVFLILYAMRRKESGNWMIDGASIKELFKYKVSVWHLALLGVFMGIVLLLLVRSGNTGEELAPAWERTIRNTMEQYLIVRPRFKEFLLGYPAIFIGAYFLQRGYKQMVPFAAFFATIGLSNCIDTFAHLHTPLWVAFLRTFHALWIGVVLGIILWLSLILSNKILLKIKNSSSGSRT